jgi:hypothetical protein
MHDPLDQYATLVARIAELQADIEADAAEDTWGRRLELAELRDQADALEQRLPFVHQDEEALDEAKEAARYRAEELEVRLKDWDKNTAHHRSIEGEFHEAMRQVVRIEAEQKTRREMDRARQALASWAEDQAREEAQREWTAEWDAELGRLKQHYPDNAPGLVLGDPKMVPPRWELERAKEMRSAPVPEEYVARHRERIQREQSERFGHITGAAT